MEVRKNHLGYGLYATKSYRMGSIIFKLEGEEYDHPLRETIYVGDNKHIYDQYGMYINHSFEPTTCINGYNIVALMNLNEGDEITFNYNESEIVMANPFYVDGQLVSGKK